MDSSSLPPINVESPVDGTSSTQKRCDNNTYRCQCGTDKCNDDLVITGQISLPCITDKNAEDIKIFLGRIGCERSLAENKVENALKTKKGIIKISRNHFYPVDYKIHKSENGKTRTTLKNKSTFWKRRPLMPRFRSPQEIANNVQAPSTEAQTLPPLNNASIPTSRRLGLGAEERIEQEKEREMDAMSGAELKIRLKELTKEKMKMDSHMKTLKDQLASSKTVMSYEALTTVFAKDIKLYSGEQYMLI